MRWRSRHGGGYSYYGEAALRAGAGLVRVLTRSENIAPLLTARPELMDYELALDGLSYRKPGMADVVAIGPRLAQQEWEALQKVENFRKPMLWMPMHLNLLARLIPISVILRYYAASCEAPARLLGCSVAQIERDRLHCAKRLVQRYGGVVLKGAGTVVAAHPDALGMIHAGNAGTASGGMGDALSGIIGALLGQ
ncbi:NAD(P)H-hydrate dehydratase [Escherichia coli]